MSACHAATVSSGRCREGSGSAETKQSLYFRSSAGDRRIERFDQLQVKFGAS